MSAAASTPASSPLSVSELRIENAKLRAEVEELRRQLGNQTKGGADDDNNNNNDERLFPLADAFAAMKQGEANFLKDVCSDKTRRSLMHLNEQLPPTMKIPLRRVGEVPDATVEKMMDCAALKKRTSREANSELALIEANCEVAKDVSAFNKLLISSAFCPLKIAPGAGGSQHEYRIDFDDENLVSIRRAYNEDITADIAIERKLLERVNASGQYAEWHVWDMWKEDRMDVFEVATRILHALMHSIQAREERPAKKNKTK